MVIKVACVTGEAKFNIELKMFTFSGGEEQVRLVTSLPKEWAAIIYAEVKNSSDLMRVFMVCNACAESGAFSIKLKLPYFPYSRQDRVCYEGEANGIKIVESLFGVSGVNVLETWDLHNPYSTKGTVYISNITANNWVNRIEDCPDWIVAPDSGSIKRASECCADPVKLIKCEKERDPDTGYLSKVIIHNKDFPSDADLLIVDDICDGGRTFINLAKELRKHTSGKIKLFVTHGIFSQGLEPLLEHIDHIYTANCMWNPSFLDNPKLTLVKLDEH